MTMIEPAPAGQEAPSSLVARAWNLPLWGHLVALLVVLMGIVALTSPPGTQVADDGSYQLQLRALEAGSWEWPTATDDLDPDGTHYPVVGGDPTRDGMAPYVKHPAWPWLAHAVTPVTGVDRAYLALDVLGALALAALAWALAAEHDRGWSRWAFWLAGTSPVVLAVVVPWAHVAAAVMAALAVLGAVRLVHRRAPVAAAAMVAAGVIGGCLLRTEGLLFAGAVGVALVVGGRRAGRSWAWSGLWGAACVALGLVVVKAEAAWIRSITGGGSTTFRPRDGGPASTSSSYLDARVSGAVRSTFDAARPGVTAVLAIVVVAAAVTAALAAAGRPRLFAWWAAASAASVAVLAWRVVWLSNFPVSGMAAAWPIVVSGVAAALAVAWRRLPLELTVVTVYAGAVFATQYADGGAGSWGGRFFALMTVPLVVIATLGIVRLQDAAPEPAPGALLTARRYLVALLVVPAVLGVVVAREVQSSTAALYDWVDDEVDGLAVTPAVELPRLMWRDDVEWLVVDDDDGGEDLAALLDHLAVEGPSEVQLVLLDDQLDDAAGVVEGQQVWREVRRVDDGSLTIVTLSR